MRTTLIGVILLLALVSVDSAATQANGCFNLTSAESLKITPIVVGSGLTADQIRELRSRLTRYGRPDFTLDGMGLSDAQVAQIMERIAVQTASWKPLGYPCAPFKSRAKVVALAKKTLVRAGFRPAMRVTSTAKRQVQMMVVRDGLSYVAVIAKTGARQVTVAFAAVHGTALPPSFVIRTPFVA